MASPQPISSARPRRSSITQHSPGVNCTLGSSPLGPGAGHLFGTSPGAHPSFLSGPISASLAGSSPPSSLLFKSHDKGAKKFLDRLKFDHCLEPSEYTVGFIESVSKEERKSGAEAWSLRVHDQLKELPYTSFVARFSDDDIPYHRIAFISHHGARVWESDYHKKRMEGFSGMPPYSAHDSHGCTPNRRNSSITGRDGMPPLPPSHVGTPPAALPRRLTRELDTPQPFSTANRSISGLQGGSEAESESEDVEGESSDDEDPGMMGQQMDEELEEKQVPEECWIKILNQLDVREICMLGRVNTWLRQLAGSPCVWEERHRCIFGEDPPAAWNAATVRRMCRRSELKAARWVESDVQARSVGYQSTAVLQFDDSKVVSADAGAIRMWSHITGRRIATLQGHTGRVTCLAFDDAHVVSGCTQSAVRLWDIDDSKCVRTLRGHDGAITGVAIMPGSGIPVSCSEDGHIKLWDIQTSSPILDLECHTPVHAVEVQQSSGYIVSAGHSVRIWDANSAQLLNTLRDMADGSTSDEEHDPELAAALGHPPGPHHRTAFTSVSYSGSLIAAGRAGGVVLWDTRDGRQVGTLVPAPPSRRTTASSSSPGAETPQCSGVQLDEWKLVSSFNHPVGGSMIQVHDIRAAGKSRNGSNWLQPVLTLKAPARINCFRFHGQSLLAGLEGHECIVWDMQPPGGSRSVAADGWARADESAYGRSPFGRSPSGLLDGRASGQEGDKKKEKERKKGKVPKVKGKYPKRSTK